MIHICFESVCYISVIFVIHLNISLSLLLFMFTQKCLVTIMLNLKIPIKYLTIPKKELFMGFTDSNPKE